MCAEDTGKPAANGRTYSDKVGNTVAVCVKAPEVNRGINPRERLTQCSVKVAAS
jgi:hypothetical protein